LIPIEASRVWPRFSLMHPQVKDTITTTAIKTAATIRATMNSWFSEAKPLVMRVGAAFEMARNERKVQVKAKREKSILKTECA